MTPSEGLRSSSLSGGASAPPPPNIPVPAPAAGVGPPRPSFIPPKLDPLRPGGEGPFPPPGGSGPAMPPLAGGQDKLRKVIMIIVFIAFLVVVALIVLLVVGSQNDARVDRQVGQPPQNSVPPPPSYDDDYQTSPLAVTTDAERMAAVERVKRAIEVYYRDYQQDPIVNGLTAQDRWANLMGVLVTQGYLAEPVVDLGGAANYDYHARADGKAFVLSAILVNELNPALTNDIDGLVLGANCDDPVYCAGYVK